MAIIESIFLSAALLGAGHQNPGISPDPLPAFGASAVVATVAASAPVPDTIFDLGRFHGVQDAQHISTRGDFLRGFGWGLVAGPVGAVVAVRRSSSAAPPVPETRRRTFLDLGPEYEQGYQEGLADFFPPRRREATLAGSMIGSVGFAFILLQVVDLPGRRSLEGNLPDPDPGFILVSFPLGSPRTLP